MTKYILQSGGLVGHPELKRKFHREVVKGLSGDIKILLCNFAQKREEWEPKFEGYCQSILKDMPDDVRPTFELAMPDTFVDQIQACDVLYCHGGDNDLIEYRMSKYKLPDIWEGKIVSVNSASSQMLSAAYYTNDWRLCRTGFGILPIKFIPHYMADPNPLDPRGPVDWPKVYEDLAAYGDTSLPIHALKEGEFVVIEQ